MWIQPLGWEDPLEEEMATHPSILAWKIPWTEEQVFCKTFTILCEVKVACGEYKIGVVQEE